MVALEDIPVVLSAEIPFVVSTTASHLSFLMDGEIRYRRSEGGAVATETSIGGQFFVTALIAPVDDDYIVMSSVGAMFNEIFADHFGSRSMLGGMDLSQLPVTLAAFDSRPVVHRFGDMDLKIGVSAFETNSEESNVVASIRMVGGDLGSKLDEFAMVSTLTSVVAISLLVEIRAIYRHEKTVAAKRRRGESVFDRWLEHAAIGVDALSKVVDGLKKI